MKTNERATGAAIAAAALFAWAGVLQPTIAGAGPDLQLDGGRMARSAFIETAVFHPPKRGPSLDATVPISGSCVLHPDETCVGGPGIRKLLRFDVLVHNIGDQDLFVGDPANRLDLFTFSSCHGHYHVRQAALYELLDASGALVTTGRKQGFCMEDTVPSVPGSGARGRYNCDNQGISAGFADLYPWFLDCQWIDVTDVPAGDYALRVVWNPDRLLPEDSVENNEAVVSIEIPEPPGEPPAVSAVRSPSASTRASAGRPLLISWHASGDHGIATQEIWFSGDDGVTWTQLIGDLPGTRRSWSWSVPARVFSDRARIRVVARDWDAERGEATSSRFTIRRTVGRVGTLAR